MGEYNLRSDIVWSNVRLHMSQYHLLFLILRRASFQNNNNFIGGINSLEYDDSIFIA